MNRTRVGEIISPIKRKIKALNKDAFITDRFIYSLLLKHGAWILKREDSGSKLLTYSPAFQTLDYVELIEVDKIEASCTGLKSDCTIMRTKDKLPNVFNGYWGPLVRGITSIDGSEEIEMTEPGSYLKIANSKNFKYNKSKYAWYINEHLYFPNIDWEAVKIEGMWEDDITFYKCSDEDSCVAKQDRICNIPGYLHAEIESQIMQELGVMFQIPQDPTFDKQNINR